MTDADPDAFIRPDKFWRTLGLRANQTVVHLGCGAGFYLIPAAKMVGSKGSVLGVDVREDMLAEVEGRASREGLSEVITTIRANLENKTTKGLAKEIADWTLVANILYQADPVKIMKEAKRVTKPGGNIVIVEWDIVDTPLGPPPETRLAKGDILAITEGIGLKLSQEFTPSSYHYGLILTK